jgi:hypothetical protein
LKFERSERTCSKCNNNHRKSDDLRCFLEEAKHPDLNLNNKIQWNDSYIGKMYLACNPAIRRVSIKSKLDRVSKKLIPFVYKVIKNDFIELNNFNNNQILNPTNDFFI